MCVSAVFLVVVLQFSYNLFDSQFENKLTVSLKNQIFF